jgi:hypothetical protein
VIGHDLDVVLVSGHAQVRGALKRDIQGRAIGDEDV